MKILVSGSRNWLAQKPIEAVLRRFPAGTILVHGDARGVDRIAADVGRRLGFIVRPYPALAKGRQWPWAGPVRNQDMLDSEHPDPEGLFIDQAFFWHEDPTLGKGTKDMHTRVISAVPAIIYEVCIGRGR